MKSPYDAEIIEIISSRVKIDPTEFTREMTLDSAGLDSIDIIETVFELEDRFNIAIPFNANAQDRDKLRTAGDVIDLVTQLIVEAETPVPATSQA
jgi:acyl carrier protein